MAERRFEYCWLGEVLFGDGLRLQEAFVEARRQDGVPDTLFLLEHPHVFTLGRSASPAEILAGPETLAGLGVEIHPTNRGGAVTYHGPGQLVGYPILQLQGAERDVRRLMHAIEEVQIRCLSDFGIAAGRKPGCIGVWAGDRKIGSQGIHLSRWITSHGFALNVSTDLSFFEQIVPCGMPDCAMTSMERELGTQVRMAEVVERLTGHWGEVFQRTLVRRPIDGGSVQVVVRHDPSEEILLLRRHPSRGGFWQIITGMIEPDEDAAAAARRELKEETGIDASATDLGYGHCFIIDSQLARTPSPAPQILKEHAFAVQVSSRKVSLAPTEHEEYQWVPFSEALARVRFQGNRKAIERALANPRESLP
ncbi:MAG: lipoyl(octanoyl) transferase LipB [Acidobacteria bacterium]|nr:lipoyl(octanoyl) transferase LipB [Acidobacteriota bacterium]